MVEWLVQAIIVLIKTALGSDRARNYKPPDTNIMYLDDEIISGLITVYFGPLGHCCFWFSSIDFELKRHELMIIVLSFMTSNPNLKEGILGMRVI